MTPRALALVLVAACRPARSPPPPIQQASQRDTIARAEAYERGTGVARDYARAAAIYNELCANGDGDLAACIRLDDARYDARGVSRDRSAQDALRERMCARGDVVSCAHIGRGETSALRPGSEEVALRLERACKQNDARACYVRAWSHQAPSDGTAQLRYDASVLTCEQGSVEGCGDLLQGFEACREPEVADEVVCGEALASRWKADRNAPRLEALDRLTKGCDAGDALACDYLPGRRIAPDVLCAAHDYDACAEAGCFGDDAASTLATEHSGLANCDVAGTRALAAWRRSGSAQLPPVVSDQRIVYGPSATKPFAAIRFWHHGGRDRRDWPRWDLVDINDQPVTELAGCAYAEGPDGKRIAMVRFTRTAPLAPGVPAPLELAGDVQLPTYAREVHIAYDRIRFSTGPAAVDASRCP